jgi:hypothetical protein
MTADPPVRARPPFYASAIDESEALIEAAEIEGVDEEIAILRVRLKKRLDDASSDLDLILRCARLIVVAVAARYRMSPRRADELATHLAATISGISEQILPPAIEDV